MDRRIARLIAALVRWVRGLFGGEPPSQTSQAVAAVRAGLQRPHTPGGDAGAQAELVRGMSPGTAVTLRPHLVARTRFFDDHVLAAIDRGIGQIVILGAGYDDRALRFRAPGVQYFEIDHSATQRDKRRRLEAMSVDAGALVLAPADFRVDAVADVLAAVGHDVTRPTLFLCEGLLVYLDQDATVALLGGLRRRAADGSQLIVSLAIHRDEVDSNIVVARSNAVRRRAATEPWRTILPVAGQTALLQRGGWEVTEAADDVVLNPEATPERSLLAAARPAA